jgi:hypothetical protein
MWRRFLDFISSLKLTLACLSAAAALVFLGTLAQVQLGTHKVQMLYFQSFFVWWPLETADGWRIPVFPGGHLLGAVLLVNLLATQFRRFQWNLRNAGLHLIHGGLILMLAGGLFTDLFSIESQMQLAAGETKNYSEGTRDLQPVRYVKPYSITLKKFTHECYPGTGIPKNFASHITLNDPAHAVSRDVVISMNRPFRYAGDTYYQAGFGRDGTSSILQVVRNPGFAAPYIACGIITLGLLVQFYFRFAAWMRKGSAT